MCDADDQNNEFFVPNFVEDTVVTCAKPAQSFQVAFQGAAQVRVLRKPIDSVYDPRPFLAGDALQLLSRTLLNPNREDHAGPYPNPEPGRLGHGADR